MHEMTDSEVECMQVEWVFVLTSGELCEPVEGWPFAYWYEGPPKWCEHDFEDRYDCEYRTAIECRIFHNPDYHKGPEGWTEVACFVSSGETECPCRYDDGEEDKPKPDCKLCDGGGYIYLGDGWCEVVYKRPYQDE